tara:strand:+ start:28 stop:384 length:357 start_codon:yes stop_codon:yes gene_type:complete
MKILFKLFILLFFLGCNDNPERHLKLGEWYLQRGLIDEAITEFREVSRLYPKDYTKINREEFEFLGTAHFKLALAYTKKGWWEYALKEAKTSFDLTPSQDAHELVSLIEEKISLDINK